MFTFRGASCLVYLIVFAVLYFVILRRTSGLQVLQSWNCLQKMEVYIPPGRNTLTLIRISYNSFTPNLLPYIISKPTLLQILDFLNFKGSGNLDSIKSSLPREFPRFNDLPREIQDQIWQFAMPPSAFYPFYIKIRSNKDPRPWRIWGIGPFAMLKVCRQSRHIARSIYKPRLEFCITRDNPRRVLCTLPNTIPDPMKRVCMYSKEWTPSTAFPVISELLAMSWMDFELGIMLDPESPDFISFRFFENWPAKEDDSLLWVKFLKSRFDNGKYKRKSRMLPRRLQNVSLARLSKLRRGRCLSCDGWDGWDGWDGSDGSDGWDGRMDRMEDG
jgi:hypothetical protein